jgi:hypothetical protein
MAAPTTEDASEFLDSVNEVSRLIDGLRAGTISPEYIDSKYAQRSGTQRVPGALTAPPADSRSGGADQKHSGAAKQSEAAAAGSEEEKERRARLQAKVQELKANRDRKLKARERYDQYVRQVSRSWELRCDSCCAVLC